MSEIIDQRWSFECGRLDPNFEGTLLRSLSFHGFTMLVNGYIINFFCRICDAVVKGLKEVQQRQREEANKENFSEPVQ